MQELFVITAVDGNHTRCSNVFLSQKQAEDSVISNFFDVWEGFTNKYVVIEKMTAGQPWTCEEVKWYRSFRVGSGFKIVEIDKPQEFEGICNFGVG